MEEGGCVKKHVQVCGERAGGGGVKKYVRVCAGGRGGGPASEGVHGATSVETGFERGGQKRAW